MNNMIFHSHCFFFQAEDGIRDCLLSRGLGDVYKRQRVGCGIYPSKDHQVSFESSKVWDIGHHFNILVI